MSNGFTGPLGALLSLQRALDRARHGSIFEIGTSGRGTFPPINIFRDAQSYIVVAELPGVSKSELDVQVYRNRIRVTGRKTVDYGHDTSIHRAERSAGGFNRTIALPFAIDPNAVTAELRNGILALKLTPPEEEKSRSITLS